MSFFADRTPGSAKKCCIGHDNLLKRSLLLIESWCVQESSVYTPEGERKETAGGKLHNDNNIDVDSGILFIFFAFEIKSS